MTVGGTMIAEDSDYTVVTSTGASVGLAQYLFVKAPIVTFTSAPTPTVTTSGTASLQTGTFTINFSVKAQGSDIYIDSDLAVATSANATVSKMSYLVTKGANGTGTLAPILTTSATVSPNNAGMYRVVDGTTETFTLTGAIVGAGAPAFYSVSLTGLGFAISDVADGTIVMNWGLADFKTPSVFLSN
jgi:hypothetical protein